jgi:hypothetical protein
VANEENLKPFGSGKLTESEERELQRKGGKNSGKARSIKAREKAEWEELLSLPMKSGKVDKIKSLADVKGANLTVSKAMKAKIVSEVLKGNLRAYELLLRCVGMDEPEPPEGSQGQTNSFVDALNNTAAEVWANENEAPEKE